MWIWVDYHQYVPIRESRDFDVEAWGLPSTDDIVVVRIGDVGMDGGAIFPVRILGDGEAH